MPYILLARLCREELPVEVAEAEDIHKLLSLTAAGLVVADIPVFVMGRQGGKYASAAKVTAITPAGFAAVKKRRS